MEAKDIKPGQRWKIEAEVEVLDSVDEDGDIRVKGLLSGGIVDAFVDAKHFVSKVEEPLSPCDRVQTKLDRSVGVIVAIVRNAAWVDFGHDGQEPVTFSLDALERIND